MTTDTVRLAELEAKALTWVNSFRRVDDQICALKPGTKREPECCTLTVSLPFAASITSYNLDIHNTGESFDLPPAIVEFVELFDDGMYPHLESV